MIGRVPVAHGGGVPLRFRSWQVRFWNTYGFVLSGAVFVLLVICGVNYGNRTVFALGFLIAFVVMISIYRAGDAIRSVSIKVVGSEGGHAGDRIPLRIEVHNRSRSRLFGLSIYEDPIYAVNFDLAPRETRLVEVSVATRDRGLLKPIPLTLMSTGHIPFVAQGVRFSAICHAVVAPRLIRLPSHQGAGGVGFIRRASGTAAPHPIDRRAYREGDTLRSVDWVAAARGLPMTVKVRPLTGGDAESFDFSATPAHLQAEDRLSVLTGWVVDGLAHGAAIEMRLPGGTVTTSNGPHQRHELMRALATADLGAAHGA